MIDFFVILFGLMIGSFLNVCIYRIPEGLSVVKPRSKCPHCGHPITAIENIPVVSYLFLGGKCLECKTKISPRYMFVELLTAFLFWVTYAQTGLNADLFMYAFFISLVITITFIDFDHQIIPNTLLLVGLIPGLYPFIRDGLSSWSIYITGGFGLGLSFYAIARFGYIAFKKEAMGMGDVKYAALIGLIMGWQAAIVAMALAFLSAAAIVIVLFIIGKANIGQRIPFGPYMSIGAIIALFWYQPIIDWYLSFILA
ncbi:MAG: prepilin peptidase [Simkaniaceae bacterium]|nr:prepilin peptidase [Simkaniaceae bacterium]